MDDDDEDRYDYDAWMPIPGCSCYICIAEEEEQYMDTVMLDIATTTRETFSIEIHRPNLANIESKMKDNDEVLTFQDSDGVQVLIPVRHILSLAIMEKGQDGA